MARKRGSQKADAKPKKRTSKSRSAGQAEKVEVRRFEPFVPGFAAAQSTQASSGPKSRSRSSAPVSFSVTAATEATNYIPCLNKFVAPARAEAASRGGIAFGLPRAGKRWAKKTLIVSLIEGVPLNLPNVFGEIKRIASMWLEGIDLTMLFFDHKVDNADIRVTFSDLGRYYSLIGTDSLQSTSSGGSMNLGFDPNTFANESERRRLILHEFGHALGLDHEHKSKRMQFNENAAIAWLKQNGLSGLSDEEIAQQVRALKENEIDNTAKVEFDMKSVMMYQFPPSVAPPDGTPNNTELSETDKATIKSMYGGAQLTDMIPDGLPLKVDSDRRKAFYLFGKDEGLFHFQAATAGTYELEISCDSGLPDIDDPLLTVPFPYEFQRHQALYDATFQIHAADARNPIVPGQAISPIERIFPKGGRELPSGTLKVKVDNPGYCFVRAWISNAVTNEPCRFVIAVKKS
ncbi:hypothetical protein GC170_09590 [bacterium]|nr:hypothetical protein [bacterium]